MKSIMVILREVQPSLIILIITEPPCPTVALELLKVSFAHIL